MYRRYKKLILGVILIMLTVTCTVINADNHNANPVNIESVLNVDELIELNTEEQILIEQEHNNQEIVDTQQASDDVDDPSTSDYYRNTRAYGTLGNVPYTYDTYYQSIVFDGRGVANPTFPMINESLYQTINGSGVPTDNYKITRIEFRGRIATGYTFMNFFTSTNAVIVGLENLDVTNTAYFDGLFYAYTGPTQLVGLESWNMASAMSFKEMFAQSGSADISLHLPWGSSTRNVKNTFGMFRGTKYKAITGLETWNVISLQDTQAMFISAENITSLDLTWGSNTRNISMMSYMFYQATKLENILGTETWNLSGIASGNNSAVVDFLSGTQLSAFNVPYTFGPNPKSGFFENGLRGTNKLDKIIVPEGNNADFFYKSGLPNVVFTNGYKGYWAKQGDNQSQWTSNQLMSGYATYQPKAGTYYKVKEYSTVNFYLQPDESMTEFVHVESITVKTGNILSTYPDMNQYGDTFFGWYRDSGFMYAYDVTQEVRFDMNLYGGIADTSARLPLNPYNVNDFINVGDTTAASQNGMLQIVSIPEPLSFGNQKIGQGYQQFESETMEPSVQVFNHPRRDAGWNLSVSMSKFSTGTPGQQDYHEVDGRLNFSSTYASSKDTNATNVDTINDAFTVFSNDQPTRIAQANSKKGKGHWIFSWFGRDTKSNANVNLELDTHALKPGTYESNVEWILSSVPE